MSPEIVADINVIGTYHNHLRVFLMWSGTVMQQAHLIPHFSSALTAKAQTCSLVDVPHYALTSFIFSQFE